MIVVDTNVISYALIEGDRTDAARQVATSDPKWTVPVLWRHEFLNVLATAVRAKILSADQAADVWRSALKMLRASESPADFLSALQLAIEENVSAYDAQYISLARTLGVQCVTEDKRLLKTFPETAISMEVFCAQARQRQV